MRRERKGKAPAHPFRDWGVRGPQRAPLFLIFHVERDEVEIEPTTWFDRARLNDRCNPETVPHLKQVGSTEERRGKPIKVGGTKEV